MHKRIISVPRSGQHFTEEALRFYHHSMNLPFLYCEYYGCCQTRPCKLSIYAYQKNHDFELNEMINDNDKIIFLYRNNLLQQIESHFRFHLYSTKTIINDSCTKINYNDYNRIIAFKQFVQDNKRYYREIYTKYKNKNKHNILEIEYDSFIINFNETFKKILIFFDVPIDDNFIEITKQHINPCIIYKISHADCYYNELENYIKDELM
jgi:hypothetical protein